MSSVPDEFRRSQLAIKALFFVLGFQYATWVSGHSQQSRERVRLARTGQPQQHS
ncbi:hypothetical protein [Streptomyces olivochromogenes]|nr:hypothetical protein [Streptomyces olivochromogenes]